MIVESEEAKELSWTLLYSSYFYIKPIFPYGILHSPPFFLFNRCFSSFCPPCFPCPCWAPARLVLQAPLHGTWSPGHWTHPRAVWGTQEGLLGYKANDRGDALGDVSDWKLPGFIFTWDIDRDDLIWVSGQIQDRC